MPNPAIPTGLAPVAQNFGFNGPDGVESTDIAGGMPRTGLRWARGVQLFRVTLILKPVELSVWSAFFHRIIKKGALPFDMPLDSGMGVATHTVVMVPGTYSASRTGGAMTAVSFSVWAESNAYDMTDAEAQSLIDIFNAYGDGSGQLLDALAQFANHDTLVLT